MHATRHAVSSSILIFRSAHSELSVNHHGPAVVYDVAILYIYLYDSTTFPPNKELVRHE